MKNAVISILLVIFAGSCQQDGESCLQGKILKYNCCAGVTTISLSSYIPLSKTITEGTHTYRNVIIVPGYIDVDGTQIFLRIRNYDAAKDSQLLNGPCYCAIRKEDSPTHVISESSPTSCP